MTEDASIRACPQCGTPLPGDAPQGLCPQCLLMNGLASRTAGMDSAVNTTPTMGQSNAGSRGTYRSAGRFIPPTVEQLAPLLPQMEILELLGQGGMGAVYKARQRGLDRLVAVKILPPDLGQLPGFADRFTREARALAKLNHPNIVSVFDFGQTAGFGETASESDIHTDAHPTPRPFPKREQSQTGGLYYLIMEYIDGVNLRQAMRAGVLAPPDALAIVPQVCEALQFAHDEGIVHRDIKPENILIDKRGKVKIADFGLAKLVAHDPDDVTLTREGGTMGTPHYMAPEQVQGAHGVDHRADIYSLGVVFYEMLTGELPLGRFAVPSKKVKIDVRLDEVVLRSLEREPELRYQHASEMKTQVDMVRGLTPAMVDRLVGREYKSKATLFGLPLLHIAFGIDPRTGRKRVAKGIIAIGDVAKGVVALGGLAMGGIAFGGVALGVISIGGLSLGLLLAVGGAALGALAFGGLAIGGVALGGFAVGLYAFGGEAMGAHIWSSNVEEVEARRFFDGWAGDWSKWLTLMGIFLPIAALLISVFSWLVLRAEGQIDADHPSEPHNGPGRGEHGAGDRVHRFASGSAGDAHLSEPNPRRTPTSGHVPSNVFTIMAVATLVSAVFTFLLLAGALVDPYHFDAFFRRDVVRFTLMTMQCLAVPAGIVMLLGGLSEGAALAGRRRAAAVMGMLPLTPAWLITLPLALWTLGATGSDREEVKARTSSLQNDPAAQVDAPATWLAGVAVLNWLIIIMLIILMATLGPPHLIPGHWSGADMSTTAPPSGDRLVDSDRAAGETEASPRDRSVSKSRGIGRQPVPTGPLVTIIILSALASGIMYLGAMRMRRLEGRGLAKLGAVCAMLVTPGNIIGLPVGIWVLEVLGRRKVRDAFDESASVHRSPDTPDTPARPHTLLPALLVCLGTLPYLYATVLSVANGFDISDGNDSTPAFVGYLMMMLGALLLVIVALILRGAWHLLSLSRRGPAVLGSLLALPLGLWALVVLSRPAVRDAFEERDAAASPDLARPRSVPVLAIINILFGVAMLFLVVFAALPADGSDQVNALWDQATPALTTVRTVEMVLLPVQYIAAGLMLASGIGLLMWRPWGRKLAVGVCIYMLIDFFVQVPILVLGGLIPLWKLVRDPRYMNAMQFTDPQELFTFTIVLTFICLCLALMVLTYLITQLVLLTSDRVVTAFEKDQPERVVTV